MKVKGNIQNKKTAKNKEENQIWNIKNNDDYFTFSLISLWYFGFQMRMKEEKR